MDGDQGVVGLGGVFLIDHGYVKAHGVGRVAEWTGPVHEHRGHWDGHLHFLF